MHQLSLDLPHHGLRAVRRSTDDDDRQLVVESVVPPALAKPGPSSVFDLAAMSIKRVKLHSEAKRPHSRVVELPGGRMVRTVIHETETEEWQEREYQRRARQVVPRPARHVVTVSEKQKKLTGVR
jgi:hypothetical protein